MGAGMSDWFSAKLEATRVRRDALHVCWLGSEPTLPTRRSKADAFLASLKREMDDALRDISAQSMDDLYWAGVLRIVPRGTPGSTPL